MKYIRKGRALSQLSNHLSNYDSKNPFKVDMEK